jgi:hypothetical protein
MNATQEAISHKQLGVPNDLGQDASVEMTGELKANKQSRNSRNYSTHEGRM